jgi:hypothetical protein
MTPECLGGDEEMNLLGRATNPEAAVRLRGERRLEGSVQETREAWMTRYLIHGPLT